MTLRRAVIVLLALLVIAGPAAGIVSAQAKEMFVPSTVYRTGAYAPSGIPFANGLWDYLTVINERDGGVNGVRLVVEECETQYATKQGGARYERLKCKNGGALDVKPRRSRNTSRVYHPPGNGQIVRPYCGGPLVPEPAA